MHLLRLLSPACEIKWDVTCNLNLVCVGPFDIGLPILLRLLPNGPIDVFNCVTVFSVAAVWAYASCPTCSTLCHWCILHFNGITVVV